MTRFIVDHDRGGVGRPPDRRRDHVARALAYWRDIAPTGGAALRESIWQSPDGRTLIGTIRRGDHAAEPCQLSDGSILIGDLGDHLRGDLGQLGHAGFHGREDLDALD